MGVFWKVTDRTALHLRWRWTGRLWCQRYNLSNGEQHTVMWFALGIVTVLVRPRSALTQRERSMYRSEQERLARSLRQMREKNAPADVIQDTLMRMIEAVGREHRAEMAARRVRAT